MLRGCRICLGKPKRGQTCMFCGLRIKTKKEMDKVELRKEESIQIKLEYLLETRQKCIKFAMLTTGCDTLDASIILHHGDWIAPADRAAVQAVNYALKAQETPTRAKTLELALLYGTSTTNKNAIARAMRIAKFADEQKALREDAATRKI